MKRVFVLVLDSLGIGASQDAALYGDAGADTFGHIAEYCVEQQRFLHIPHLTYWGLTWAALASTGRRIKGLNYPSVLKAAYGYAVEQSKAKDTLSGHWEVAGVPVLFDWGYFHATEASFPASLLDALVQQGQLPGILGNCHASGPMIIERLGAEHIASAKPIVYTSGDSVFQIAAHEEAFGLERLYKLCVIARQLVDSYRIGRVIARPFLGTSDHFYRTSHRLDLAMPLPRDSLLDAVLAAGGEVVAIGKIADIFAQKGISQSIKADGHMALFEATLQAARQATSHSLIFANFVDFDANYGHRRDVAGYAKALEAFDARLPELEVVLQPGDIVFIIADHGCDPTWVGFDHTREHIPVLLFGSSIKRRFLGRRESFADIGQSIAYYLGLGPLVYGFSFM